MKMFKFLFTQLMAFGALIGNQRGVVTTDQTNGTAGEYPADGQLKNFQIYGRATVLLTGVTNDLIKVIPVRAGTLVKGSREIIVTQGVGTTIQLDIGVHGATADGFNAAIDATAAAGTQTMSTPSDTYPAAGGYYFATDGFLEVKLHTITGMTTAPVVDLFFDCEMLKAPVDYTSPVVAGNS